MKEYTDAKGTKEQQEAFEHLILIKRCIYRNEAVPQILLIPIMNFRRNKEEKK